VRLLAVVALLPVRCAAMEGSPPHRKITSLQPAPRLLSSLHLAFILNILSFGPRETRLRCCCAVRLLDRPAVSLCRHLLRRLAILTTTSILSPPYSCSIPSNSHGPRCHNASHRSRSQCQRPHQQGVQHVGGLTGPAEGSCSYRRPS